MIFTFYFLLFTFFSAGAQTLEQSTYFTGTQASQPIPYSVTVSARVGEFWFELQGWTSPFAEVELTMGRQVKKTTTANEFGEFVFRTILPRKLEPICLMATDVSKITSHPLCLAPPPLGTDMIVKGALMPPTLKIDKGKLAKGETVAAQGYTTPNSEVMPYLFEEKPRPRFPFSILHSPFSIPAAYAAVVPKPEVKSNQAGFFQFNLPSEEIGKDRIFVGSIFLNNPSPKSTTLTFNVFSWWRMLLEKIIAFLTNLFWLILRFLITPEGIILLEIGVIGTLISFLFIQKSRSLSA